MDAFISILLQVDQIIGVLAALAMIFQWIHLVACLPRNHFTCGFLVICYLMSQTVHSIFGIIYYSLILHFNLSPTSIVSELTHAFLLSSTSLHRLTFLFFSVDCYCMTYFPIVFKKHSLAFLFTFGITVTTVSSVMIVVQVDAPKITFIFDLIILGLQIASLFLSKFLEFQNRQMRKFSIQGITSNLATRHQTARNLRFLRTFTPALCASTIFGVISSIFLATLYFLSFPWYYLIGCYHVFYDLCCLIISLVIMKAIAVSPAATWEMGLATFLEKWIFRTKSRVKIQTLEVRSPNKESVDVHFQKLSQLWA